MVLKINVKSTIATRSVGGVLVSLYLGLEPVGG